MDQILFIFTDPPIIDLDGSERIFCSTEAI